MTWCLSAWRLSKCAKKNLTGTEIDSDNTCEHLKLAKKLKRIVTNATELFTHRSMFSLKAKVI